MSSELRKAEYGSTIRIPTAGKSARYTRGPNGISVRFEFAGGWATRRAMSRGDEFSFPEPFASFSVEIPPSPYSGASCWIGFDLGASEIEQRGRDLPFPDIRHRDSFTGGVNALGIAAKYSCAFLSNPTDSGIQTEVFAIRSQGGGSALQARRFTSDLNVPGSVVPAGGLFVIAAQTGVQSNDYRSSGAVKISISQLVSVSVAIPVLADVSDSSLAIHWSNLDEFYPDPFLLDPGYSIAVVRSLPAQTQAATFQWRELLK